MALPSNASTGIVTGTFVDGAGNPLAGTVTFTPSTAVLDSGGNTIIAPAPLTTTLDANGSFTITLVATDDPDLNPSGWTWGVRFSFATASIAAFSFAVPSNSTTDLSAAAPVPSSPGNAITKGDPGDPSIYELRGTGSPVGVVTPASAGIYYTDTAGTCGAWRWLSTGTTNTSWIVDLGDTGLLTVNSLIDSTQWTVAFAELGRTGNVVNFVFRITSIPTTFPGTIIQALPGGFLPVNYTTLGTAGYTTSLYAVNTYASRTTLAVSPIASAPTGAGARLFGAISWVTADPWPTTLP